MKRSFYEAQAIQGNWSVKELQRQIGSLLFERTCFSTDKKGLILDINKKADLVTPEVIMRDPYVFEFVGLEPKEKFAESNLEEALISHLQVFLLELGKGFCFESRQKRLTIDGEYYFVDLVFLS
jgi:predicted nuclease of restriction endonuclease-like (RecB) superfamily